MTEDWALSAAKRISSRIGEAILSQSDIEQLAEIIREESRKAAMLPDAPVLNLSGGPLFIKALDQAIHMLLEHGSVKIVNCDGKASPSMLEIGAWLAHLGKEGK